MDLEFVRCQQHLNYSKDTFKFDDNWSYTVKSMEGHEVYPVGHYYTSADLKFLMVCKKDTVQYSTRFDEYVYILCIVSAVFLSLTLLVHLFYPKFNYHAMALLCYVTSMTVTYICMAVHRFHYHVESVAGRFCLFSVYYVSALSTYMWLSVIAYGLWKAFARLHLPCGQVLGCEIGEKRWFVLKCLYAWGIPLVMCVLVIGLSHHHNVAQHLQLTLVTYKTTFFDTKRSVLVFLYGPMALILAVNLGFFGLTIWNIRRASQRSSRFRDKNSRKLLYLCVKLFVVMGITWVADVISFMVINHVEQEAFYWSDVINGLQGVAIFVVYVCKKSTWRMIKRRCGGSAAMSTDNTKSHMAFTEIEMLKLEVTHAQRANASPKYFHSSDQLSMVSSRPTDYF